MPVAWRVGNFFHDVEWRLSEGLYKLDNCLLLCNFFVYFHGHGYFDFDLNRFWHLYLFVEFDFERNSHRYHLGDLCGHFNLSVDQHYCGNLDFFLIFLNNRNFLFKLFHILDRLKDLGRYLHHCRPLLDRGDHIFFRLHELLEHLHITVRDLRSAHAHRVGTGTVGRPDTGATSKVARAIRNRHKLLPNSMRHQPLHLFHSNGFFRNIDGEIKNVSRKPIRIFWRPK